MSGGTTLQIISTAFIISSSVVVFPVVNRMVPKAQSSETPIAAKTCDMETPSAWHAAPASIIRKRD